MIIHYQPRSMRYSDNTYTGMITPEHPICPNPTISQLMKTPNRLVNDINVFTRRQFDLKTMYCKCNIQINQVKIHTIETFIPILSSFPHRRYDLRAYKERLKQQANEALSILHEYPEKTEFRIERILYISEDLNFDPSRFNTESNMSDRPFV